MTFRLRVFALVSLVAVIAVGATAYLAFRQAASQVRATAVADQDTVTHIVGGLTEHASSHGSWDGVAPVAADLKAATGQRIKLVTEDGVVAVDTDTLEGRAARAVSAPPILVDPRPTLTLSRRAAGNRTLWDAATDAITAYRSGLRLATCLARMGAGAEVGPGDSGVPEYRAPDDLRQRQPEAVAQCGQLSQAREDVDIKLVHQCRDAASKAPRTTEPSGSEQPDPTDAAEASGKREPEKLELVMSDCLQKAFMNLTKDVAPAPLRIYLGAIDDPRPTLTPTPVIAAAVLVALLAIAATALLSRRVLRPIGTLTAASERLGEGDLTRRVPVKGRDELARLAGTFNRMADALQRGEERQRRLVADVAHELRTPLANLRGYLEALKDGVIPPDPALFASLHEEAVLQQRIVDDLQDLALAEAGTLAYHRVAVDIAELLETCRIAHAPAAEAAGVRLAVRAASPLAVHADPDRLRQVIGNLITNALRATPPGGSVTLFASAAADLVVIEVRDSGDGIAAADLPHVFDRFWRADQARARHTGGNGLGLAIARQIITDHHGTITITSQPGTGTVVTISLPSRLGSGDGYLG